MGTHVSENRIFQNVSFGLTTQNLTTERSGRPHTLGLQLILIQKERFRSIQKATLLRTHNAYKSHFAPTPKAFTPVLSLPGHIWYRFVETLKVKGFNRQADLHSCKGGLANLQDEFGINRCPSELKAVVTLRLPDKICWMR